MKRRVVIGSNYRPNNFERRTAHEYQALRPPMSRDAELLQRALLSKRASLVERVVAALKPSL